MSAALLEAKDYRSFIRSWIEARAAAGKPITYASIARAAGFAARSFPRDVALGKKRLSLASLHKFAQGMRLSGAWTEYFRLLVELEHPDCRTRSSTHSMLERRLDRVRARLKDAKLPLEPQEKLEEKDDAIFHAESFPLVYAALGSPDEGATLQKICQRTQLAKSEALRTLRWLEKDGSVERSGLRFKARSLHVSRHGRGKRDIFRDYFLKQQERAAREARARFQGDDRLFMSACFSVESRELARLKEELREVLLRFAEGAEACEGDRVSTLVCSLF